jgi:flagellar biosynthesis protein FliQ
VIRTLTTPRLLQQVKFGKLWNEGRFGVVFRAPVIIPLVFTVVALFLANKESADRTLSLVLQIITILVAIGKFSDVIGMLKTILYKRLSVFVIWL